MELKWLLVVRLKSYLLHAESLHGPCLTSSSRYISLHAVVDSAAVICAFETWQEPPLHIVAEETPNEANRDGLSKTFKNILSIETC